MLAHILAGRHYAGLGDHDTVIDICDAGLRRVEQVEGDTGSRLPRFVVIETYS